LCIVSQLPSVWGEIQIKCSSLEKCCRGTR